MLKKTLMIGLLLAAAPSLAFAQGDMREQGDKACGRDASRICKAVLQQGDSAILSCFQQNAKKLSAPCFTFLKAQGQIW